MFDRVSMLVGTGVVTAGVSAALLTGAGVAVAATEPGGGEETSTSEPSSPESAQTPQDDTDAATEAPDEQAEDADEPAEPDDTAPDVSEPDVTDGEPDTDEIVVHEETEATRDDDTGEEAPVAETAAPTETVTPAQPEPVVAEPDTEPVASVAPTEQRDATTAVAANEAAETDSAEATVAVSEPASDVATLRLVSASEAPDAQVSAPTRQTLLSVIGTVVFNLYSFAIRVLGGPPLLPWGSTVTVRSSTVTIDCGDGYEVPADWYVPEGATPTRLIYLQHGFLAAGPFYSYTASRLAEATHSIVVTTSLTSNFLACDGCWVGGSPMHKAVADLFREGNTALADSALAAGYGATLLDGVNEFALAGHSAGGGLAAGAAGYMVGNGAIDRLAGVVMLDGVGFGNVLPQALAKLPDDLPIYNLAGKAYYWNMNGSAGAALQAERPDRFNGVRLVGGLHSDTMLGGNPFIQAGLNLVTGWSKIENVKAAELLSAAWINDMFAGAPTPSSPYYGAAGDTLTIETSRGMATAYVMPGPPERLTLVDRVFQFFSSIIFGIDFATCAAPEDDVSVGQGSDLQEISTSDTALSLDGSAKPGQSIGQHVCTG